MSSNTVGISISILGLIDKNYLKHTYEKNIGKATVTSYCIKFASIKNIDINVLKEAILYGYLNNA